jgi:hypothetical protein
VPLCAIKGTEAVALAGDDCAPVHRFFGFFRWWRERTPGRARAGSSCFAGIQLSAVRLWRRPKLASIDAPLRGGAGCGVGAALVLEPLAAW